MGCAHDHVERRRVCRDDLRQGVDRELVALALPE
jgi:hypothetical protein